MQNYTLTIDGVEFHIRGDGLPRGRVATPAYIELRTSKKATIAPGPNYSDNWNSIAAALAYEPMRANVRWDILKFLLNRNTVWQEGHADLVNRFGTDALRRVRELRDDYGWPVEEKPRKQGAWWYRMNHNLAPPPRRLIRRQY